MVVILLDALVDFDFTGHMTLHHAVTVVRADEALSRKIPLEILDHALRLTLHQCSKQNPEVSLVPFLDAQFLEAVVGSVDALSENSGCGPEVTGLW